MAPVEKDLVGYWGEPTSTMDWCEANYEVSYYVAEFWNTVSNVLLVVLPLVAAHRSYKDGLELRFLCSNLSLLAVGVGSCCFHGTLMYRAQLLDELPMVWGSACLIYSIVEIEGKPQSHNRLLLWVLSIFCTAVTIIYLVFQEPMLFLTAYGGMVFTMIFYSLRIVSNGQYKASAWIYAASFLMYGTGFIIWNLDNLYCPVIRELRSSVSPAVRPALQGHAWWHVLSGGGTYASIMYMTYTRLLYLRRPVSVSMVLGVIPVVRTSVR